MQFPAKSANIKNKNTTPRNTHSHTVRGRYFRNFWSRFSFEIMRRDTEAFYFRLLPTYLPSFLPFYLSTYLPTYLPTYQPIYLPTYRLPSMISYYSFKPARSVPGYKNGLQWKFVYSLKITILVDTEEISSFDIPRCKILVQIPCSPCNLFSKLHNVFVILLWKGRNR